VFSSLVIRFFLLLFSHGIRKIINSLFKTVHWVSLSSLTAVSVLICLNSSLSKSSCAKIRQKRKLPQSSRMSKTLEEYGKTLLQSVKAPTDCSKSKIVMVIGSTGFLGPYILASLLSSNAVHGILCINRNPKAQERTLSALEGIRHGDTSDFARLHFVVADITRPTLGLTDAHVEDMGAGVDEIIFNAWDPNWGLPLRDFFPLLDAVKHAIDFSHSSIMRPRITFISSICAIGEWPRNHPEQRKIPEDVVQNGTDAMANGYAESKCVAELLLAQASADSGLGVAIVRAGQIGGTTSHSLENCLWPKQGWIYSIIDASKKKKVWPTHVQPLDWIPVDALADGIATIVSSKRDRNNMQVYNMVNPKPAPWSLLLATLRVRFGFHLEELSLPQWLESFDPHRMKLFHFLNCAGHGREYDMVFENKNASKVLPSLSPITMDVLDRWLTGWDLQPVDQKSKL
jgi:thioester reductase-like protein